MKNVLIMEDDLPLSLEWKEVFEANNCKVVLTRDAVEAIAHLEDAVFDLVVTDLFVQSGKGGLHVLTKLQTMGAKAPPCIAVTGAEVISRDGPNNNLFLAQAERLGSSIELQKPFEAAELVLIARDFW